MQLLLKVIESSNFFISVIFKRLRKGFLVFFILQKSKDSENQLRLLSATSLKKTGYQTQVVKNRHGC